MESNRQTQERTNDSPRKASLGRDPNKWPSFAVGALILLTPIIAISAVLVGVPEPTRPTTSSTPISTTGGIPTQLVSGETVYKNTCMLCHGADAQGSPHLGKPLRNSAYIQNSTDQELIDVITNGRFPDHPLNTTGVLMPARGAQNISDEAIVKVVGFLREIQDPSVPTVSMEDWVVEQTASRPAADPALLDHPGREAFLASCSACHGTNAEGIEGLGKSFITSEFVRSSSDKDLMTMIKMGRPVWDPANTTGLDMPPKGGNPAITDDQLTDIIGYIRSVSSNDD
ncbi:MAG: c-type cytochrome [Phycisphaerales bacterium]